MLKRTLCWALLSDSASYNILAVQRLSVFFINAVFIRDPAHLCHDASRAAHDVEEMTDVMDLLHEGHSYFGHRRAKKRSLVAHFKLNPVVTDDVDKLVRVGVDNIPGYLIRIRWAYNYSRLKFMDYRFRDLTEWMTGVRKA